MSIEQSNCLLKFFRQISSSEAEDLSDLKELANDSNLATLMTGNLPIQEFEWAIGEIHRHH